MSIYDDIFAADAQTVFSAANGFGESIVYTPAGGTRITLNLDIDRLPPESTDEAAGRVRRVNAFIPHDPTGKSGVAVCNLEDLMMVSWRLNDPPQPFRVKQRTTTDIGGWSVIAEWSVR